ncbi:hypothetical protein OG562_26890 [Streptomyces sp. NBC_01275]|uniref:hypothetical protein n=1 Tax=Streptomyces sp. NBC_01275 TaxID=2903807 RepID=UPI00225BC921|nr:hypothetical protein [Streptomyces sp. NBC_01275]MCX4764525.1 hypothetical protein [Streptomyces sp. NBC_01275]
MRTPQSHADRIRNRIAAGDADRIADEALRTLTSSRGCWHAGWGRVLDQLVALPAPSRHALLHALAARHPETEADTDVRCGALVLRTCLSQDLNADALNPDALNADAPADDDLLAAQRRAALHDLGRRRAFSPEARLELLAEAELAAGHPLPPPTVATFRRAALETTVPGDAEPLLRLTKTLTTPPLNVGEEWAEQALRDTTTPDWQSLLTHATKATKPHPTATWENRARTLLAPLAPAQVRTTVLPWLTLVGRPRTFPLRHHPHEPNINHTYDPHNATALRGLTWFLALLPPHPDTPPALAALAETSLTAVPAHGPRSPKIANAAVLALTRIADEPAHAELARLAAVVTYRSTAKLIDTALRARAAGT